MSEQFNGWTNRETWAVVVNFDNNGQLYDIKQRAVKTLSHLDDDQKTFILERVLSETLESYLGRSNMPKNYDILKDVGSLWRVNWREIAESYISEMAVA
jgi:hypothetical protein